MLCAVDLAGTTNLENWRGDPFNPLAYVADPKFEEKWHWIERKMKQSHAQYLFVGTHYPVRLPLPCRVIPCRAVIVRRNTLPCTLAIAVSCHTMPRSNCSSEHTTLYACHCRVVSYHAAQYLFVGTHYPVRLSLPCRTMPCQAMPCYGCCSFYVMSFIKRFF